MSDLLDPFDAKTAAAEVLRRDRRRIRTLAILTIGLWVLAALLIPSVYLPLGAKVKRFARILDAENPGAIDTLMRDSALPKALPQPTTQQVPEVLAKVQHQNWIIAQIVFHQWIVGAMILGFALAAGILASASTVALALTIRRVTLRQVAASLAEISEQLRQLKGAG